MKLSTIIPVYNAENFLRRCLDSVVDQGVPSNEIICVDDGSTDNSLDILKEYELKYSNLKVISQHNQHAGIARNTGIDAATGDYIHFLDADDYLYSNVYPTIMQYLEEHPKIDYLRIKATVFMMNDDEKKQIMASDYTYPYLDDSLFGEVVTIEDNGDVLIENSCVTPWTGIYKRDMLKDIRFSDLPCIEDREFYIRVILNSKYIVHYPIFAVCHQKENADSIMGRIANNLDVYPRSYLNIKSATIDVSPEIRARILRREFDDIVRAIKRWSTKDFNFTNMESFFVSFDWKDIMGTGSIDMEATNALVLKGKINYLPIADLIEAMKNYTRVYMYGAGRYGKIAAKTIGKLLNVTSFLVSEDQDKQRLENFLVKSIEDPDICFNQNSCFFLSTKSLHHISLFTRLRDKGALNIFAISDREFDFLYKFCWLEDLIRSDEV